MAEYNPAGVTVMPNIISEEQLLGMNNLGAGNLINTDYGKLFENKDIQEGIVAMLKTNDFVCEKLELVVTEPGDDFRKWQIACDPAGDKKQMIVVLAVSDVEESCGSILWIPFIQKLKQVPTVTQLQKSNFKDETTFKVYQMKKRFAVMKAGDVALVNPYMWYSLGYNTTKNTTRILVATFGAK